MCKKICLQWKGSDHDGFKKYVYNRFEIIDCYLAKLQCKVFAIYTLTWDILAVPWFCCARPAPPGGLNTKILRLKSTLPTPPLCWRFKRRIEQRRNKSLRELSYTTQYTHTPFLLSGWNFYVFHIFFTTLPLQIYKYISFGNFLTFSSTNRKSNVKTKSRQYKMYIKTTIMNTVVFVILYIYRIS